MLREDEGGVETEEESERNGCADAAASGAATGDMCHVCHTTRNAEDVCPLCTDSIRHYSVVHGSNTSSSYINVIPVVIEYKVANRPHIR